MFNLTLKNSSKISIPFLLLDPLQLHKSCNPDQNAWMQSQPKNGNTINFNVPI